MELTHKNVTHIIYINRVLALNSQYTGNNAPSFRSSVMNQ